jgi:hypothetical protein
VVCDAKRADLCGVLEVKRDDLCRVPDDAGELGSGVFSVSRANRSPPGMMGDEEGRLARVDVDGGPELGGEDDRTGLRAVDAVDTWQDDLCGVLDAKLDSLHRELDHAGELVRY